MKRRDATFNSFQNTHHVFLRLVDLAEVRTERDPVFVNQRVENTAVVIELPVVVIVGKLHASCGAVFERFPKTPKTPGKPFVVDDLVEHPPLALRLPAIFQVAAQVGANQSESIVVQHSLHFIRTSHLESPVADFYSLKPRFLDLSKHLGEELVLVVSQVIV